MSKNKPGRVKSAIQAHINNAIQTDFKPNTIKKKEAIHSYPGDQTSILFEIKRVSVRPPIRKQNYLLTFISLHSTNRIFSDAFVYSQH